MYTSIYLDRVKRIWYLSPMRAAKVQTSLCICAGSPEPSLLAHTSNESRGTFRQKARSLAPLNGWACTVKICHDGMLEDTNSLDVAHLMLHLYSVFISVCFFLLFEEEIRSVLLSLYKINSFLKCYLTICTSILCASYKVCNFNHNLLFNADR